MTDKLTQRQFAALAFVAALSPLVRRFPRTLAALAGRGALIAVALSALLMLPPLLGATRIAVSLQSWYRKSGLVLCGGMELHLPLELFTG